MGEVREYLLLGEMRENLLRFIAVGVAAATFNVVGLLEGSIDVYSFSGVTLLVQPLSWLFAVSCYTSWRIHKTYLAIAQSTSDQKLEGRASSNRRYSYVFAAGFTALQAALLSVSLVPSVTLLVVMWYELFWYAMLAGAGMLWGNRATVWGAILLDTVLATAFILLFVPPVILQPPAAQIVGTLVGVFLALSLGELLKAMERSALSGQLFRQLLDELASIEEALLENRSDKIPAPIWMSAFYSGMLLDIGRDDVVRLTKAHAELTLFNDHPSEEDRKNALTAIQSLVQKGHKTAPSATSGQKNPST
jgi:hypothetical protein